MLIYKKVNTENEFVSSFGNIDAIDDKKSELTSMLQVNTEVQKKLENYISNINFLIENSGKKKAFEMKKMAANLISGIKIKKERLAGMSTTELLTERKCCVNIINLLKALRYSYGFMWDNQTLILLGMQLRFFKGQLQGYAA
ncbi:hypothetical protein [Chondrinema litorale]|uniref:hypothetical protein n=1 Tax=Chondrinema litorale TaxID=2994555 RepID=UPI002543D7F4|nr:hypothetical protein [Chondrinema litorale]UZR93015.1 hypothetical protein OQ292_14230 [Chondrinema litorale]